MDACLLCRKRVMTPCDLWPQQEEIWGELSSQGPLYNFPHGKPKSNSLSNWIVLCGAFMEYFHPERSTKMSFLPFFSWLLHEILFAVWIWQVIVNLCYVGLLDHFFCWKAKWRNIFDHIFHCAWLMIKSTIPASSAAKIEISYCTQNEIWLCFPWEFLTAERADVWIWKNETSDQIYAAPPKKIIKRKKLNVHV